MKNLALFIICIFTTFLKAQDAPHVEATRLWTTGQDTVVELENEGFESGLGNFVNSGVVNWTTTGAEALEGSMSATSNLVVGGQTAILDLSIDVPTGYMATVSFYIKADTTQGPDLVDDVRIGFEIDAALQSDALIYTDWTEKKYFISEGSHLLSWQVYHNAPGSDDQVQAYLDTVVVSYHQRPALRMADGSEGFGKILVSDAHGNASWKHPNDLVSYDNPDASFLVPLTLDGRQQVDYPLTIVNGTATGVSSNNNSSNGFRSSFNGDNGFYALNNTGYGFNAELNDESGFHSINNGKYGFFANNNQLSGFRAFNNSNQGFSASDNGMNGFKATNNGQDGFFAEGNGSSGFQADNNYWNGFSANNNGNYGFSAKNNDIGFVAENNAYGGLRANNNADHGFQAVDNTGDGFYASSNTGNGVSSYGSGGYGFYAANSGNNGFQSNWSTGHGFYAWNNNANGFTAKVNIEHGFYAENNGIDGFNAYQNTDDGFTSLDNGDDGYASRNNADDGIETAFNTNHGVYAFSNGNDGVHAWDNTDDGVVARGNGDDGVYSFNNTGLAGRFGGDVVVSGMLSKGGGSFKIDHPLDPENKFLFHSFVESPDMMNVYNGNVILDANGEAVIQMEEWFEPLNRDFRYQLTCIGGFAPVYIAEKISNNRFKIAGGTPGMEVSWQVTGIRQDPFANQNRIEVEVEKPAEFKGYYFHPEAYGRSFESGFDYVKNGYKTLEELNAESETGNRRSGKSQD